MHDKAQGHTHAYPIASVAGKQVHLRMPHGLRMADGKATEVFSPWRTFKDGGELRIPTAVSTRSYKEGEYPFPAPLARHARHVTAVAKAVHPLSTSMKPGLKWSQTMTNDKGKKIESRGVESVLIPASSLIKHRTVKTWDGYLRVDKDDLYEFSIVADHGAVLKIGDEQLIDSRYLRQFRPFTGSIRLQAGLHRFGLEHHFLKSRSAPHLKILLNGRPLSEGAFEHQQ